MTDPGEAVFSFPIDASGSLLSIKQLDVAKMHNLSSLSGLSNVSTTEMTKVFLRHALDHVILSKDGFDEVRMTLYVILQTIGAHSIFKLFFFTRRSAH
jgi:hypothetical protein